MIDEVKIDPSLPPAARVGDVNAHGIPILGPGLVTVLIGSKPAARVGDMSSVCPIPSGTVPHGAGPIAPPGCPTVLIGGSPAARIGDLIIEPVGGPVPIASGEPTVLIGDG